MTELVARLHLKGDGTSLASAARAARAETQQISKTAAQTSSQANTAFSTMGAALAKVSAASRQAQTDVGQIGAQASKGVGGAAQGLSSIATNAATAAKHVRDTRAATHSLASAGDRAAAAFERVEVSARSASIAMQGLRQDSVEAGNSAAAAGRAGATGLREMLRAAGSVSTATRGIDADLGRLGSSGSRIRAAAADIGAVEAQVRKLQGALNGIQNLAGLWASLAGARAVLRDLIQVSDAIASIEARLRLATESEQEYQAARQATFAIAQRASTAFESVAQLYTRIAQSTKSLGLEQARQLQLTEAITAATRLSGGSSESAAAGVMQLAQAFASGVLSGDEFRSVMENSPRLVKALSDSLGIGVGELRKLAEQQKLTSGIIAEAILLQSDKLKSELSTFPATVGAATQQASNAWGEYVNALMNTSGESSALAAVVKGVADTLLQEAAAANKSGESADVLASGLKIIVIGATAAKNTIEGLTATVAGMAEVSFIVTGTIAALFKSSIEGIREYQKNLLAFNFVGAAEAIVNADKRALAIIRSGRDQITTQIDAVRASWDQSVLDVTDAFERLNQQANQDTAATDANAASKAELEARTKALREELERLAGNDSKAAAEARRAAAAANQYGSALQELTQKAEAAEAEVAGPLARAEADHIKRIREIASEGAKAIEASRKMGTAKRDEATIQAGVTRALAAEAAAYAQVTQEIERKLAAEARKPTIANEVTAGLRDEVEALRLSNEQREIRQALRQAEELSLERFNRNLSPEERSQIEQTTSALYRRGEAIQKQQEYAKQFQQAWSSAINSVAQAFGDWVSRGFRGFKDFLNQALNALKQWVAQVFALLAQRALTNAFASFVSGSTGSSQGGLLANLGNLVFGNSGGASVSGSNTGGLAQLLGLGGSGGALSGFASTIGPALPVLGPIAGVAYGLQNPGNNGAASAARVASYGYAGYALGTVGYGALLGGAAGAATGAGIGAAAGGAVSGAAGAAAAIPIVGWIVAALAIIDAVSGGKLFGTKWQTKGATTALNIGPDGSSAALTLQRERQAAFFGGLRRDNQPKPATPEMIAAARGLFTSVQDVMIDAARRVEIEVPPVIQASLETIQKFDKKGRVKSTEYWVTVLGERIKETSAELAGTRIAAEAIIDVVARSVGDAVSSAPPVLTPEQVSDLLVGGANPDDIRAAFDRQVGRFTIRDGGEGLGPGANSGAVGAAAALTNEVHRIAERWRSDAEMLMEGAQFLLQAQEDVVKGRALLGQGGTLTQLTDLIEDLQRGEESLSETYVRVYRSASLLDEALRLSGVTLDRTREDVVRFAQSIVDAAGGLDRAQALWQSFFDGFYSQGERAINSVAQIQADVSARAATLGLDAAISANDFRARFEAALPTLQPGQVVQWLEFGQALLQLAAARDQVANAERNYSAFLLNIAAQLGEAGPANALDARLIEIRSQYAQAIGQANELARAAGRAGASEQELALIHRWAARQVQQAIQELEQSARSLIEQLGYTGRTAIEAEIARLEAEGGGAVGGLTENVVNLFEQFEQGLASVKQSLQSWKFGPNSFLNPEQQLAEVERQLNVAIAAAQGGNIEALNSLSGLADIYLNLVRGREASGQDFNSLSEALYNRIDAIQNPYSAGQQQTQVELVPSAQLLALYAQRDALDAQADAQRRLQLANELASQISQLAQVERQSWLAVADRLGVNLAQFVGDLGATAEARTVEQVGQLANIANTLNVELAELAGRLGLNLGQLADQNSLLNDSFEERLASIPAGIAEEIRPTWEAFINAATQAEAAEQLERLNQLTNTLPEQFRLQLAPYLESVDPETRELLSDLVLLENVDANTATANDLLRAILATLQAEAPTTASAGKSALGGLAGDQSAKVIDLLTALQAEVIELRRIVAENGDRLSDTVDRSGRAIVDATADAAQVVSSSVKAGGYSRVSGGF
ncbi:hypothetical protein C7S18_12135 [Ahniella affigens]|uniref:Tape measure protein N-terminal domain-containing protein n=1 Tax=Ahniella affigens TaxID=2021234 RepID=A0A2P1PSV2_9GAMM|nr:tape measure protein [Ahniella affigens]AVP97900.1 hypothetical protein C7S18_12135 [Ahniella affigens]